MLSVSTAVALFNLKIIPMLSYSLDRVWGHLTESCFESLEKSFCTYMKRVLCLHPKTRNRFVYIMAKCVPAVETIRIRLRAPPTEAYARFVSRLEVKVSGAVSEVGDLDVYVSRSLWADSGCKSRHVYTRYIVHGYHHVMCSNRSFHYPDEQCICQHCSEFCSKYHCTNCEFFSESLHCLSRSAWR